MTETAPEKEKKRPRPLELNHSNLTPGDAAKDMKEFAIKCVSPGLPPLSAKMRSTVMMSKTIEAQQRHIIAQRIAVTTPGGSEVKDSDDDDTEMDKEGTISQGNTPSTSGITNNMEDLSIPSSASSNKRLKRDKVPTPLNLGLAQSAPRPLIKSAPIYNVRPQHFTPVTGRRSQFRKGLQGLPPSAVSQRFVPGVQAPGPHGVIIPRQRPMMTPMTAQDSMLRQVPTSAYPHQIPHTAQSTHFHRGQIAPNTATTLRNPASYRAGPPMTHQQLARYQQQLAYQQHQWAKFKQYQESQKVSHVTDVFQGEGTRFAPLEAQPLSAQRSFFDLDSGPIRPQVVSAGKCKSKDRITEESEDEEEEEEDDDGNDDPESAAIEDDAEVGAGLQENSKVDGALKLGNNMFKFEMERYGEGESDKQRFLKHCAAAWDQFTKMP